MIQNVINIYLGIIQPIVLKTNKERLLPKSSYNIGMQPLPRYSISRYMCSLVIEFQHREFYSQIMRLAFFSNGRDNLIILNTMFTVYGLN